MQDIESAQALVTRDDIRGGITFRMANMQACAAGIGETYPGHKISTSRDRNLSHQDWAHERIVALPRRPAILVRIRRMDMVCGARPWKAPDVKPRMDTNEHQFTEEPRYSSTVTELVDALRHLCRDCTESSRLFVLIRG